MAKAGVRRRAAAVAVVATLACGTPEPPRGAGVVDLTGAGATFPYPLYRRWFADYATDSGVRINYLSVGSEEGLSLLAAGQVDFGAVDRELTTRERGAPGCERVAVPTVAGAIAVVYNLPDLTSSIRTDADLLADIFAGRVTRWDDRAIAARNPGVALPAAPITVVHRGEGSGTSRAFSRFLASSKRWPKTQDARAGLRWPAGVAVEGNEGVAAQVKQTVGSIGYAEMAYATQNHLQVALVRNALGEDVLPDPATIRAAVDAAFAGGSANTTSMVLARAPRTYPIGALTWLVLDPHRLDAAKGRKAVGFLRWALHDGAAAAARLEYVPLPPAAVAHYDSVLNGVRFEPCAAAAARRSP